MIRPMHAPMDNIVHYMMDQEPIKLGLLRTATA
jgi:hypothetical protein